MSYLVSYGNSISGTLRGLFTLAKNAIAPTPEAELPLIRHQPMPCNDELQWWDDRAYLEELKNDILDELRGGAFLWEMPIEVWSERLVEPWPDDDAATLLALWRAHLDGIEAAA
jgi:hypothetical protein